jgi:molybdopterin synthase sulfur carrier subunit
VREFTIEAKNLRGVIKAMERLYPSLGRHLEEETAVAIDGAIHEVVHHEPIQEGYEIFFTQARSLALTVADITIGMATTASRGPTTIGASPKF